MLQVGLSVGLIALVIARIDLRQTLLRLVSADMGLVAIAYLLATAALALAALRWQSLVPHLLTYPRALKYSWIGLSYSLVLPGAVSGDVA